MNKFIRLITNTETKENKKRIVKIAMKDTYIPCFIALCFVGAVELSLFIYRLIDGYSFTVDYQARYLISYAVLFVASGVFLGCLIFFRKNLDRNYRKMRIAQTIYAFLITAWSVFITIFDADHHQYFSGLVYVTIIVIVPFIVYINRYLLFATNFIGDVVLAIYICEANIADRSSTLINFVVFAMISYLATTMFGINKHRGYIREIQLQDLSERDHLTRLYNRQKLHDLGKKIINDAKEQKKSLAVVMMDIDNFKALNDNYGHQFGDEVLVNVTAAIKEIILDEKGHIFRYGGEEFLALLPDMDKEKTARVLDRVQNALLNYHPWDNGKTITISMGAYVSTPKYDDTEERLCKLSDELLYVSKTSGKNRYTINEDADVA